MGISRRNKRFGKAECPRCGFVYKLKTLSYEWSGQKVCRSCWDPLPAQDFPRPIHAEDVALDDPRPRNDIVAATGKAFGEYQIIGRDWPGQDLRINGGEVTRR